MTFEHAQLLLVALATFAAVDFVLRARGFLRPGERRGVGAQLAPVLQVPAAYLLAGLAFLRAPWVPVMFGLGALHLVALGVRVWLKRNSQQQTLGAEVLWTGAHVATLVAVVWAFRSMPNASDGPVWPWGPSLFDAPLAFEGLRLLLAWSLVAGLGQDVVRLTLEACRAIPAAAGDGELTGGLIDSAPRIGRWIGVLERLLVVTLHLNQAWAGIGLILAAKSIARFKDLEERSFSEYYLVGTLTSVFFAVAVGTVVAELFPALAR